MKQRKRSNNYDKNYTKQKNKLIRAHKEMQKNLLDVPRKQVYLQLQTLCKLFYFTAEIPRKLRHLSHSSTASISKHQGTVSKNPPQELEIVYSNEGWAVWVPI